jgi:hypothetical protein
MIYLILPEIDLNLSQSSCSIPDVVAGLNAFWGKVSLQIGLCSVCGCYMYFLLIEVPIHTDHDSDSLQKPELLKDHFGLSEVLPENGS